MKKNPILSVLLLLSSATYLLAATQDVDAGGADLLDGPAAELDYTDGESAVFEPGEILFSDRDYLIKEVPEPLRGFEFIRGTINGVYAECRQAGLVFVLTPSSRYSQDSCEETLSDLGFQRVNLPECALLGSGLCPIYQKQVTPGEVVSLGKWGVLVLPRHK